MKKALLIAILVALVSVTPVFSQGAGEATVDEEKPVTIELWYWAAITEAGPLPQDWVGFQILKDKYNIELKLTQMPSDANDQDVKIQAAGAANALPDAFMISRNALTNLVKQNLVAPVDDLYELMPTRNAAHYNEAAAKRVTYDGKCYGLVYAGAVDKNEGMLIRKDWLDNLGLEVPTNTDELLEVLRAFTFNDPDGNGKNDTYGLGAYVESNAALKGYPGSRFFGILGAFNVAGLWSYDKETAGLNVYRPEFYEAMKFIRQMQVEGIIDPNWLSYKKDDYRAAWKQGRFGMMWEQNSAYASESNYAPFDKNFPEGEWVVMDALDGPFGPGTVGAYDATYRILAISKKAEAAGKKEAIAKLLEWMSTDEGYYLCGWGQEGVNFVFDENGIPVDGGLGEMAFSGTKGQVYTQLRNLVFYNSDIELASRYPTYTTAVSGKTMSALTVLREMQSKKWTDALGSNSMPMPNADVKRYYEQSLSEFLVGAKALTPENWQAFLDQFDKIGGKAWNDEGVAYMIENNLIME